jgi:hypothetical protein
MYKNELNHLEIQLKQKKQDFISAIKGYDGYWLAKALQVEIKELEKKIAILTTNLAL